jgi:uncharacterized protein (DUF1778 family)
MPHRTHQFPRRPARINIRLSGEEVAAIEAAAEREGVTKSAFVVAGAMDRAGRETELPRRPAAASQVVRLLLSEVVALRGELAQQGSNLNQIAHAMNAGFGPPPNLAAVVARTDALLGDLGPFVDELRAGFAKP